MFETNDIFLISQQQQLQQHQQQQQYQQLQQMEQLHHLDIPKIMTTT